MYSFYISNNNLIINPTKFFINRYIVTIKFYLNIYHNVISSEIILIQDVEIMRFYIF